LGRLMSSSCAQAVAADVKWSAFTELYGSAGRKRLFDQLNVECADKDCVSTSAGNTVVSDKLNGLPESERMGRLAVYVQDEVSAVMKLEPGQRPGLKQGFFEMGMDSIMSVELRRRLERLFGTSLPATIAFDCPNVQALADHIAGIVLKWGSASVDLPMPRIGSDGAVAIEGLDKEMSNAIEDRLSKLERLLKL